MAQLSIVVPVLNEEEVLFPFYDRLLNALNAEEVDWECIFVNDGSDDQSMEKISDLAGKDQRIKFIDLSRNFGHQAATAAGLDHVTGQAIVMMDGDLQDPPELIPQMVEQWEQGAEVVYARRLKRKGTSFLKRTTAYLYYRLLIGLSDVDIPADVGDFRLIDRKVLDALQAMPERPKFLRGQISWLGFRQKEVTFERAERHAGKTKFSIRKMIGFAATGLMAFSKAPIRFLSFLGLFFLAFGILFLVWGAYDFSFSLLNAPVNAKGLISLGLIFLGIQFIGLALLGEYIFRTFDQARGRPLYVIREKQL